ncbi:MAG: helix-turn-helix domain-containing protein [Deltaproteobacteria bacterium]|nr:helix-turn-helix domain-containing protein [Deltaproteobacteria bacterium]
MAEKNLTVKETAKIFKREPKTIRRWIDEGQMFNRFIKVKDGYLIPQSEIDRILKEGEVLVKP